MQNGVRLATTIAAVLALAVAAVISLKSHETVSARYLTFSEAEASGAIGNWLPSSIPSSAKNIKETHNIDTNEVWFEFTFTDWNPESSGECRGTSRPRAVPDIRRLPSFATEWPEIFTGKIVVA